VVVQFARDTVIPKRAADRIGVNVSNYSHFWGHSQERTVRVLSDLISLLIHEGWMVTLFPSMPEDHTLSLGVRDAVDSDQLTVFGNYADRESLFEQLAAQDLFVGVKLHMVIAACCVTTPAIMIGYQPKCLDFMRTMGLETFHIRSDHLDLNHLVDVIRMMTGDLASVQLRQVEGTRSLRGRLLDFRFRDQILESLGMLPAWMAMPPGDRAPSRVEFNRW
jgi:polysaccharide pyruvyl transferase WcaK-like protein